jgi:hypothetical protein
METRPKSNWEPLVKTWNQNGVIKECIKRWYQFSQRSYLEEIVAASVYKTGITDVGDLPR